jgi:hypothetical protein
MVGFALHWFLSIYSFTFLELSLSHRNHPRPHEAVIDLETRNSPTMSLDGSDQIFRNRGWTIHVIVLVEVIADQLFASPNSKIFECPRGFEAILKCLVFRISRPNRRHQQAASKNQSQQFIFDRKKFTAISCLSWSWRTSPMNDGLTVTPIVRASASLSKIVIIAQHSNVSELYMGVEFLHQKMELNSLTRFNRLTWFE